MGGLKTKTSSAMLATRDVDRAREFYSQTLGLDLIEEGTGGVMVYRTGDTRICVYGSEFAGTNKANAVVFDCGDDIEAIVEDLRAKGVSFEQYDFDGVTFENGIHKAGDFRMVWFKDPDGNIIHLNNG
ncbi:VOC family protein [Pelagibacterium xiamenense]|uniref:VOC family protein n=1 Tax=Pelagibacterium xiamenense TaxID=2901140 RepID=UPI001E550F7F|nr:VOC family protein [Pelagibacterium xiamenense]MCD7059477.1 VOC family protein [Pelagibacterium xiamenense]